MDRGLVVGGALICASFLIAVGLNQSGSDKPQGVPKKAVELPAPESTRAPKQLKCVDPADAALTPKSSEPSVLCE